MRANTRINRGARRLFRACFAGRVFDEGRAREAAARLARSPRRGALPTLVEFERLVRIEVDRRTAIVESAVPLPADLRDGLTAWLARTYGAGMNARFAVDPSLIGGLRIRVGSHVYDGSVRGRLAALEASF